MGSNGYFWIREIARGGMGRVDLVVRSEGAFRRLCAVKRLHGALQDDPECRAMFLDEARIAGMLEHPNVIRVFDVGDDGEGPYLMMDFVDGLTVRDLVVGGLRSGSTLPVSVAVEVMAQAADGLHTAHELRGSDGAALELVHRDISPQNIMIGFDGIVRVMDFGIARSLGRTTRTSTGVLKGKFGYMSPEQLRFHSPDRRSDLFALGVVLYEMLTSRRLYSNKDGEGPRRILEEPPPDVGFHRDGLPPPLVELVFQLLAKDKNKRPETAGEVSQRLREVLGEVMFSDEDAVALKTFMSEHFVDEASQHREEISAALRRLELGALPPWPRSITPGEATPSGAKSVGSPLGSRVLVGALGLVLLAGAVGAGVYIGRAPDQRGQTSGRSGLAAEPETAPSETPSSNQAPSPEVPSPEAPEELSPEVPLADAPAPDVPRAEAAASAARRRRRRARRSRTPTEEDSNSQGRRDPLAPAAFGSIGEGAR